MQFFTDTHYEFLKIRKSAYIFSGVLILISILSLIVHGGPKYNIDFTGGTLVHLKFEKNVEIQQVRNAVAAAGFSEAEIKHFGEPNEISIRVEADQSAEEMSSSMDQIIAASITDNPFTVQRVEKVGPKIGHELIYKAILAVLWSMVLILFYIMWRFELKFGVGAIVALIHDVIITLGVFSLFEIEISAPIIAAVLTIVGYSLNDTIVVFDRIRDNLKMTRQKLTDLSEPVNRSINETLSRTIMTSGTTLIVVVLLYMFGGEVLRTFALALIIGIVVGTYSSIYVASPIVVDWHSKKA